MIGSHVEYDPAPSPASRQIISSSWSRIALTFLAPSVGRVTLGNSPLNGDSQGIVLEAGQAPVTFREDVHGDMVHLPWFALYSAGATGVGYIQSIA